MAELVQFPLSAGIEQGADPKQLPPGSVLAAENYFQDKTNRVRKRYGTRGLTKTAFSGSLARAARLTTRGKDTGVFAHTAELGAYDRYVYDTAQSKHRKVDSPSAMIATRRLHLDSSRSAVVADIAFDGGSNYLYTFFAVGNPVEQPTTGQALYVMVEHLPTRTQVMPPTLVTATGFFPRVVIGTSRVMLVWVFNGTISISDLNASALSLTAPVNLITTVSASAIFDVISDGGNGLYIGYEDTGTGVCVKRFNNANALAATSALFGGTNLRAIALQSQGLLSGSGVHVVYSESGAGQTSVRTLNDSTLANSVGPTVIVGSTSNTVFVAYDGASDALLIGWGSASASPPTFFTQLFSRAALAAVAFTRRTTYSVFAQSKPFRLAGKWHVVACVAPSLKSPSTVVLEIATHVYNSTSVPPHLHVATLANQTGWFQQSYMWSGVTPALRGYLGNAVSDVDSNVYALAPHRNREATESGEPVLPVGFDLHIIESVLSYERSKSDLFRSSIINANAFCTAAAPFYDDGSTCFPAGFAHAPVIKSSAEGGAGTGGQSAGDYYYIAVYEWRDGNGVLHRSAPSAPFKVAATGGKSITLTVTSSSVSPKQNESTGFGTASASPVMIALYRTVVGGSVFYRLTHEPLENVHVSDPTVATVACLDVVGDANVLNAGWIAGTFPLNSQPQLYTALELEDVPPPSFVTHTLHGGRIFGIEGDRRTLCASKLIGEDLSIAPGFNEALTLTFDVDKFALGPIGERLGVFGEASIHIVEGDGPDSNGQQNTWRVFRLSTDVGCTSPRSIVETPMGTLFRSTRSFGLIAPDLSVRDIGTSVEDLVASYPYVTSAVLVASESQVRFTCVSSGATNGIVLVYDYARNAWYSWVYYDTSTSTASVGFIDAMLIDGVYTLVTLGGKIYREETSHCKDDVSRYVEGTILLAHISRGGPVGYSRVKKVQILGTSVTRHRLEIALARNYGSFTQTETFAADGDVTTPGPLEKACAHPAVQKVDAIQVRVRDLDPSGSLGNGNGLILEAIGLWIQRKSGPSKLSASRRA